MEKNYYLHKSAQEAYKSYVRAYDSHSLKQIYSVNTLNLPMVALSFGFKVPPYVDLSILRPLRPVHLRLRCRNGELGVRWLMNRDRKK